MQETISDKPTRILILEDSELDLELIKHELQKADFSFVTEIAASRSAFLEVLTKFTPEIILSDFNLVDFNGKEVLEIVQKKFNDIPVIIVTGAFSDVDAVELLTAGARDYILKDRLARLGSAVQKALQSKKLEQDRKEAQKTLRENEEKYRTLFEGSHDAIMLLSSEAFFDCNSQTLKLFGLTDKREFISMTPADFSPPFQPDGRSSSEAVAEKIKTAMEMGKNSFEWIHRRKNGEDFPADILLSAINFRGERVIQATVRDITERKNAEIRIHHLGRLLKSIRSINRLITHETDQDKLLNAACDLLHKVGGYKMTWISLKEGENLKLTAQAGDDPSCKTESYSIQDNNFLANTAAAGKYDLEFRNNCVSAPLIADSMFYGILNICLNDELKLDTEEKSLIKEVAEDIAFALHSIGLRAERALALETLKESEAGLAEAQRIAHLGNWILDLAENKLKWSAEIFRIFEVDPNKFGASYEAFLDGIHPEDREMVNKAYTDSLQNKTPYSIVHRLLMKDGRIKYVREKCETYYDTSGKPAKSVGTVHDITEQTLSEQALHESLMRYSIVTESANDAIIGMKPDGTVHLWNKMAHEMFGYSPDEAIGKPLHDLIVPDRNIAGILQGMENFTKTGKGNVVGKTIETIAIRKNRTEFPWKFQFQVWNSAVSGMQRELSGILPIAQKHRRKGRHMQKNSKIRCFKL